MPLSDHEQQILQEIEKQFYDQDPKFARGVHKKTVEGQMARNFRRGIALFVVGFFVLIGFFFRTEVLIGVAAFLLMLAGATIAYQSARKFGGQEPGKIISRSRLFGDVEERLRNLRRRREK